MSKILRVGIVGASAGRGWAKESHFPAVQKLAGLELTAIAGSSQTSADTAAKVFGASAAYGRAQDLVKDENVDIVAIAVKVPDHREIALGALAAGKHVLCEWPLGRNLAEAEEMARAAQSAGVHAAIGLQTRANHAVQRARDLIQSGAIGRLLSARIYSATIAFKPKVDAADFYLEDAENGATLVSIHGGHALDLALALLGEIEHINALATIQYPKIEVGDKAVQEKRSIPDHLLVQGRLSGGGALSVEVAGGRPPEAARFRLKVVGDKGELALDGGAIRGFQSGRLSLSLHGEPQHVDDGETGSMPDTAANVAGLYAQFRDDILQGRQTVPDFDHAVRLTRLMDDVTLSAQRESLYHAAGGEQIAEAASV